MVRRADRIIVVTTGDKTGKRSFARSCRSSGDRRPGHRPDAPEPEFEALRFLSVETVIA